MEWTEHKHATRGTVYGASAKIKIVDFRGVERDLVVSLRIDGRRGRFRVDQSDFGIWVAIDGFICDEGFATFDDAAEYADRWVEAARAQRTLHPRMDEKEMAPEVRARAAEKLQ